ncbi:MAG: hypothetical protein ABIQ27_14445 [Flavobacterium sp.]|uniref:hypothetical protein n=1 Tax=Flavobacterium sp. TaxID=239 RepID=UPI0032647C8C
MIMKAKKSTFCFALLVVFLLLGCNSDDAYSDTNSASLAPGPPVGEKNQFFPVGSTVSDIVVNGTGIRWYTLSKSDLLYLGDDTHEVNYGSPLFGRVLLSPDTSLRNRSVYYATQTVNNRESKKYLKVIVELWQFHD